MEDRISTKQALKVLEKFSALAASCEDAMHALELAEGMKADEKRLTQTVNSLMAEARNWADKRDHMEKVVKDMEADYRAQNKALKAAYESADVKCKDRLEAAEASVLAAEKAHRDRMAQYRSDTEAAVKEYEAAKRILSDLKAAIG